VIIGLIENNDETDYRKCISDTMHWCEAHNLILNVNKTKEMIFDFRKGVTVNNPDPLYLNGTDVEIVQSFKYLGVVISNNLNWSENTQLITKKASQRLYFLRKLREFNVNKSIMHLFYLCSIQSVIEYGFLCWYGALTCFQRRCIDRIIKQAKKISGCSLTDLESLYKEKLFKKTTDILQDSTHPLFDCYEFLPSGRRIRSHKCNTKRYQSTFIPQSIISYNKF
jgi:hypothetical protein